MSLASQNHKSFTLGKLRLLVAPVLCVGRLRYLGLGCSGICSGIVNNILWLCSASSIVNREGNLPSAVQPVAFWCPRLPATLHFAAFWFASGKGKVRLPTPVRDSVIDT
jgi:hypothetical protein